MKEKRLYIYYTSSVVTKSLDIDLLLLEDD